jgi:twitching motility protein PilU
MDIRTLLEQMLERDASDLYLTVDSPPILRIEGVTVPVGTEPLGPSQVESLATTLMSDRQRAVFDERLEMNLAIASGRLGRFRVNIFRQRGAIAVVVRQIKTRVPTLDELHLPPVLKSIAMSRQGLVLVTGAAGAGKSTTQAAMLDHRNENAAGHILTVEDPIEFVHTHKKCLISQREVGFDTVSFAEALRNALRQAPDVILIGEVRDSETMSAAISFSEAGHLCLATLHSNNANQSIERVLNFFPAVRHLEISLQLALNLRGIVSQRLIPGVGGKRVAAMEILVDTPRVKDLVKRGEIDTIKEAMEQSTNEGGQTFDQSLLTLYADGLITEEQALANADSSNNLRIRIKALELERKTPLERRAAERRDRNTMRIEGGAAGSLRRP